MRAILGMGVLACLATAVSTLAAQAGTKVVIGEQNWTGASAIQHVLAEVMTRYLGAEVGSIAAAEETLYPAMDRGDGTVDIIADMWTDHLTPQMKESVLPGGRETIVLSDKGYLGTEGIFIPGYLQDQHGIRSIVDLTRPEVAKLFDSDGDGRGEWWPGATGWEATNHSLVRARSYGFDQLFETTNIEQPVMLAQLKVAYERQQPMLFYYWTPEWIHASYDLRRLEEPEFAGYATDDHKDDPKYNPDGCYRFYLPVQRPDWLEASEIKCQQPPTRVHVALAKELAERDPKIGTFLRQVTLSADQVNQWILAIEVEGKTAPDLAREWVDSNRALVEGEWLKGVI